MKNQCCVKCRTTSSAVPCTGLPSFCICHQDKQEVKDWEKEFDKKYPPNTFNNSSGIYKDYIRSLLSSQRQQIIEELREKIKRIKLEVDTTVCDCGLPYRYSDLSNLVDDLLNLIK